MKYQKVYCEITNVCNLSCPFCAKTEREPEFLSVEKCRFLFSQVKPFTDYVCLHVLGEPLLHPDFQEILSLAEESKLQVNLVTNGTLAATLAPTSPIRKVSFSLHSFPHWTYAEPAEAEKHLKRYLDQILDFADSFPGISEFRLWNREHDDGWNAKILGRLAEHYGHEILLKTQKIVEKVYLSTNDPFVWPSPSEPRRKGNYCHALKQHFAILVDGTVTPCCLDAEGRISLGNVYETELSEILSSPRAEAMRKGFRERNPCEELCRRCQFIERFDK